MSEAIAVAVIAASPGVLAAVLGYLNNRSLKRHTATASAVPIGRLLEQLDRKVDRLSDSIGDVRERMARLEGRAFGPSSIPTGPSDP